MKKNTYLISFLSGLLVFIGVMVIALSGCKKDSKDDTAVDLFADSFDSLTHYPEPSSLTFKRKDGKTVTMTVFPGQVVVLAPNGSTEQVNGLIMGNGGTVAMQIPSVGLYLAVIDPTSTSAFLSTMLQSDFVTDAFPNSYIIGKKGLTGKPETGARSDNPAGYLSGKGVKNDPTSLIQTLDVNTDMACSDHITHIQAVGNIAGETGVKVNTHDVTVDAEVNGGTDYCKLFKTTLEVLKYARDHDLPVVLNISLGGDDDVTGDNYFFKRRFFTLLEALELKDPGLLDRAVIFMSEGNKHENTTDDLLYLENEFAGSPIWDHVYVVGAQEGASDCDFVEGHGYADNGTPNYLAAPSCRIPIPGSVCSRSGNSFAAPQISRLVAKVYEMLKTAGKEMSPSEITKVLWTYQTEHNGTLPTEAELYSLCAGTGDFEGYAGTWSGTFYYSVEVLHPSGPPTIIQTSLDLTVTLEPLVNMPGYPQVLKVTSATCSDPVFGATLAVTPDANLSTAILPAAFGSISESGMGVNVMFPNGTQISTANDVAALTVDANGRILSNTPAFEGNAFTASGLVDDSNEPGSGPGGYAYNRCTFTSWSLVRM